MLYTVYPYENNASGGNVNAADTQKKAPGKLERVPRYIALYIGFPHIGVVESITATIALTLPISWIGTTLDIIVLAAIIIVPFKMSTTGAAKICTDEYLISLRMNI